MVPALHDTGSGPAILFLHAFPMDASQWDHQVAALSDRYRCLRPDFWGCGESPEPPGEAGLESFAGAILALLDDRAVREFTVVGLSLGGYVAMALLAQTPDRLRGMVLADTRAAADSDQARGERLAAVDRVCAEGTEWMVESTVGRLLAAAHASECHIADPVRGRIRRWTAAGVVAAQRAMAARPDRTSELSALSVPALVVGGSLDSSTPPDSMRALASVIPRARFHLIEGAGHLSNLEKPFAFTEALAGFLDGTAVSQ